jgi:hypothetical protein
VLRRAFPVGEEAGGLDDHVHSPVGPRERGRIALRQHLERATVDLDLAFRMLDLDVQHAVRRVVLEHVREDPGLGEIVDRHDLEVRVLLEVGAVEVAPDPAEAVDPNFGRHGSILTARSRMGRGCPDGERVAGWPG